MGRVPRGNVAAAIEPRLQRHSGKAMEEKGNINILEALSPILCLLICFSKNVCIVNWNLGGVYTRGHLVTA